MMNKVTQIAGVMVFIGGVLVAYGAEHTPGVPGPTSTGYIHLSLEISEDVTAGFLKTSVQDQEVILDEELSGKLVQSLRKDIETTFPLCVKSSGGGYFEVSYIEVPGNEADARSNEVSSGSPVLISFGEDDSTSVKIRSMEEECSQDTAIPVTIQLRKDTGEAVGRIYGKFNLLVKSE